MVTHKHNFHLEYLIKKNSSRRSPDSSQSQNQEQVRISTPFINPIIRTEEENMKQGDQFQPEAQPYPSKPKPRRSRNPPKHH